MGLGVGSSAVGIEVAAEIVATIVGGMASPVKCQTNTRAGSGEDEFLAAVIGGVASAGAGIEVVEGRRIVRPAAVETRGKLPVDFPF